MCFGVGVGVGSSGSTFGLGSSAVRCLFVLCMCVSVSVLCFCWLWGCLVICVVVFGGVLFCCCFFFFFSVFFCLLWLQFETARKGHQQTKQTHIRGNQTQRFRGPLQIGNQKNNHKIQTSCIQPRGLRASLPTTYREPLGQRECSNEATSPNSPGNSESCQCRNHST